MNQEDIKKLLPHREPMLLVDETEMTGENTAIGRYTVRGDEFFLQGHFPDNPIVPGVILCEMLAQASCILIADKLADYLPLYTTMDNVRFRAQVVPGDTVESYLTLTRVRGQFCFIQAECFVGEKVCVRGEFSVCLIPKEGR